MVQSNRFLVVDDNREFAQDLCELLALEGTQGVIALDAEEALEHLERETFQGLFTDLRLPGQSGVDLIEELNRRGLSVPSVLMTAYADEQVVERAQSAGAIDVLSKPLDIERWLTLARRLMSTSNSVPPEAGDSAVPPPGASQERL
jgi:DNA-binding NtrC family response regulator